nr:unnamed protein product [Callosobruchus analis]
MMTSPKQPPLQCLECKKSFSHLSNIKRHLKTHQANREGGTDDEKQDRSIKCILCNNTNLLKSNLLVHLEEHHNIKIERKDLHFSNELEFQKWKSDWEKKNHPSYPSMHNYGRHKEFTYICHRSGFYVKKAQDIRHLKTQAKKLMEYVLLKSNNFIQTHVGHSNALGHLNIAASEKLEIACKLASKIALASVLDDKRFC